MTVTSFLFVMCLLCAPFLVYACCSLSSESGYYVVRGVKYRRKPTYRKDLTTKTGAYYRSYTYVTAMKDGKHVVTVRNRVGRGYAKVKAASEVPYDVECTAAFLLFHPVKFYWEHRGNYSSNVEMPR